MKNKYLPARKSKCRTFILLGFLLFIYVIDYLTVKAVVDYKIYTYILKPALLISMILAVMKSPFVRSRAPLKMRENIGWLAFVFAVIYILVSIAAGLIDGFGKSPYSHTLYGTFLNALMIGPMLMGREVLRAFIINNLMREKNLAFIGLALFMAVLNLPISKFLNLKNLEDAVIFIAEQLAPEFSQNLFANYLVFLFGWTPSLIYISIIQAFHWLSPVLPNLRWITTALVGILCPVFFLMTTQYLYLKETRQLKRIDKYNDKPLGWIVTCIISIAIIWFAVGVFPIYPSVIATGSMEPMIRPGDMILVKKTKKIEDVNKLKVGDVIQFKKDNVLVAHRIIEIINDINGISYYTKGDNNLSPDLDPVKAEEIKGKVVYVVPKVGWPTLLIKKRHDVNVEGLVF